MVYLKNIRTAKCPICGCDEIVLESIDVESWSSPRKIRTHCNGSRWETRKFKCGYQISYCPNFESEEVKQHCEFDEGENNRQKKLNEAKKAVSEYVYNLDLDEDQKERILKYGV